MPAKHRRHRVETEDTGPTDYKRRKWNSEMREMGRGIVQVVSDSYDSDLSILIPTSLWSCETQGNI